MDKHQAEMGVAPPPAYDTDAPPVYSNGPDSATMQQRKPVSTRRTRVRKGYVFGAMATLAVCATAAGVGAHFGLMRARVADGNGSKPVPELDTTGPPITSLAGGFSKNLGSGLEWSSDLDAPKVQWVWHRGADGTLVKKETRANASQSDWTPYAGTRFLTAPVAVSAGWPAETSLAFALEASTGAVLYALFYRGAWERGSPWHRLGGRFAYPLTTTRSMLGSDVHAVTETGQLWRRQYTGSFRDETWLDWEYVGDGFEGPLTLQSSMYSGSHVLALKDGAYQYLLTYRHIKDSWQGAWENLGIPAACTGPLGLPRLFSMGPSFGGYAAAVVVCEGRLWHKQMTGGEWDDELGTVNRVWDAAWTPLEIDGGGGLAHQHNAQWQFGFEGWYYLVSRAADRCYYGTLYRWPAWSPWRRLWCVAEGQESLELSMTCEYMSDWTCYAYREAGDGRVLQTAYRPENMTELVWEPLKGRVPQ